MRHVSSMHSHSTILVAYPPIVLEGRTWSYEMQSVAQEMRFRSWVPEGNGSTVYPPRCRQAAGPPMPCFAAATPNRHRGTYRSNSGADGNGKGGGLGVNLKCTYGQFAGPASRRKAPSPNRRKSSGFESEICTLQR